MTERTSGRGLVSTLPHINVNSITRVIKAGQRKPYYYHSPTVLFKETKMAGDPSILADVTRTGGKSMTDNEWFKSRAQRGQKKIPPADPFKDVIPWTAFR